jgi:two-component sensor histidine kinase/integral membrane sensor domain MASE1
VGGVLKAPATLHGTRGNLLASTRAAKEWIVALGVAVTVAVAYYLAAGLGLAFLSPPSDVAVFWPPSGLAAGILIISNRRVRPAIMVGVIIGTLAANIMSDRSILTSLFTGFCYAGEAVLVAWLIERWFGHPFAFDDLRRVLGFVAATCLGAAASALGGAATMTLLHTTAPFWVVWRTWFLADGVGIVMVAPLVVALDQVWRKPPSRAEAFEAVGVLSVVTLIISYAVTHPTESWLSFDADALVLPPLLWLVARYKSVFGIAGAFIVSLVVIYATTFGIGHFGDVAIPVVERVSGAQMVITMVTLYTLVLAALFAQRKDAEDRLTKKSAALARLHEVSSRLWRTRNLHQALDEILAGAIELLGADKGNIQVLNDSQGELKIAVNRGFKQEFLDCFKIVSAVDDSARGRALRSGERIIIEDVEVDTRYEAFRPAARLAGYRAVQSTPIMGRGGRPLGVLSTHFRSVHHPNREDLLVLDLYVRQASDIIERHEANEALAERNVQITLAGKAALVGTYTHDLVTNRIRTTEGYAALHGLPEGTTEIPLSRWQAGVHPDDLGRLEAQRDQACRERRREYTTEYRIIRGGAIRWIEARKLISYDSDGQPQRADGVNIDVTERKRAEEQQRVLLGELDHRVKNSLATVSAVISHTLSGSSSMADFATALDGRVQSMARTHELLSASGWQGISVAELVRRELAPYATTGNTKISGSDVTLKAEAGQALAMVLHELATNAAKHGALSNRNGRVAIRWDQRPNGYARSHLVLEWREVGGPSVVAPEKSGFGTHTIRDLITYEFGGAVDLAFALEGVRCRVELPADWLNTDGKSVSKPGAHPFCEVDEFHGGDE